MSEANPKDVAGSKKPPIFMVPPAAIVLISKAMESGAVKYDGPYNWREKSVHWSAYCSAAMRHILSALDGERNDPSTGIPHEAHAAACMCILIDAMETNSLIDDRPKAGTTAQLIRTLTSK